MLTGTFINGETAFMADQEYNAQPNGKLSNMVDDWGFVCFPLGPNGGTTYRTIHDSNMTVIPSCYDDTRAENIAKAVDLWLEQTPGYDSPDSWKEGYYAGFRDTRAVDETIQYMMDNSVPWKAWLIPGLNYSPVAWDICGGRDPIETIEARTPELQAALDEMNK